MPKRPAGIADPELRANIMRASHALAVAAAMREPDQLVLELVHELGVMDEAAICVALVTTLTTLRVALEAADRITPGFRDFFLQSVGENLAEPP